MVYPREKTQSATRDVWVVVSNQGAAEEEQQRKSGRGRAAEEERQRKSGRGRAAEEERQRKRQAARTVPRNPASATDGINAGIRVLPCYPSSITCFPLAQRAVPGCPARASSSCRPDRASGPSLIRRALIPSRFPHFFDVSFSTNFVRNSHDCHQADVRYQVRAMRAERVARAKSSYTRGPTREIPALLPSAINRRGTAMFCREN